MSNSAGQNNLIFVILNCFLSITRLSKVSRKSQNFIYFVLIQNRKNWPNRYQTRALLPRDSVLIYSNFLYNSAFENSTIKSNICQSLKFNVLSDETKIKKIDQTFIRLERSYWEASIRVFSTIHLLWSRIQNLEGAKSTKINKIVLTDS